MFKIAGREIGSDNSCFFIAEIGVNHNGDMELAHQLIDLAKKSGADAVKFQTFNASNLVSALSPKASYQIKNTGESESQLEMLKRLELSPEQHQELINHCQEVGICFLSSPFDEQSADFLTNLGVKCFKIPSGELTNVDFLRHVARHKKPTILSTGLSKLSEVAEAVECMQGAGLEDIALLHCLSSYPAPPDEVNLLAMDTLRQALHKPVGYSDHTLGLTVALAAVARGACILEKHITLDCNLPGPDHRASLMPNDLVLLVEQIRVIEKALGNGEKKPQESELNTRNIARRSLCAAKDLCSGEVLRPNKVILQRPGTGIPPKMREYIFDRKLKVDLKKGSIIKLKDLL